MALVVQNYFDLMSNEDGDNVVPKISSKKALTRLSAGATKKNNKKQQAAKKKVIIRQPSKLDVAQDHGTMKKQVINHRRPKQELKLEVARQDNQQKEE